MDKYICTKEWPRHAKGDVIEAWEYNRIPREIQQEHFKKVEKETKKEIRPTDKGKGKVSFTKKIENEEPLGSNNI